MKPYASAGLLLALCAGPARAADLVGLVVWRGLVTVTEPVRVPADAALKVEPGARVRFEAEGRIEAAGGFMAGGAEFESDAERTGAPFFAFRGNDVQEVIFEDCVLRNLTVSKGLRPYNDFLTAERVRFAMRRCRLDRTSALALTECDDARLEDNCVSRHAGYGLWLMHCRRPAVTGNEFESAFPKGTLLTMLDVDGARITNNRFLGGRKSRGVALGENCLRNRLVANTMMDCTMGLDLTGERTADNLLFSNLILRSNDVGVKMTGGAGGNLVRNCVIWEAGKTGLELHGGRSVTVRNSIIGRCAAALAVGSNTVPPMVTNCAFWQNREDPLPADIRPPAGGNVSADPLFVEAGADDFRLRTKAFGYAEDSPLLDTGMGLFP